MLLKAPPVPRVLLTAADYRDLPAGPPYFQLIEGNLFMTPSADYEHQTIAGNIFANLWSFLRKHPLGLVQISPSDVELDRVNVHQPDVYFISTARRHLIHKQGPKGAPNLVVEVLSKGTEKLDRGAKRVVYARSGVEELWLVDREKREVAVYRFADSVNEPVAVIRGRQRLTTPLLPGFKLPLADIFRAG
jgi:Uma2 family endonuclease